MRLRVRTQSGQNHDSWSLMYIQARLSLHEKLETVKKISSYLLRRPNKRKWLVTTLATYREDGDCAMTNKIGGLHDDINYRKSIILRKIKGTIQKIEYRGDCKQGRLI